MGRTPVLASVTSLAAVLAVGAAGSTAVAETPGATQTHAGKAEIAAAASQAPSAKGRAVRDEFLVEQARSGNQVDARGLRSAEVDGAVVVWEDGVAIEEVETARVVGETNEALEMSTELAAGEGSETDGVSASGLGMEGVTNRTGGKANGGYCTTTKVSGQSLTQCFERFRIVKDGNPDRWTYFYNRWATATGQAVDWSSDWKPRKIDIRSRPWEGRRNDFTYLKNYWPKESQNTCSTNSFSVGFKGFSATVPVWNCEGVTPEPNASNIKMGAIWSGGAIFDQRSEGVDFSMLFTTWNDKSAPMGDYGYAKFCKNTDANCEGVLRKDGW